MPGVDALSPPHRQARAMPYLTEACALLPPEGRAGASRMASVMPGVAGIGRERCQRVSMIVPADCNTTFM